MAALAAFDNTPPGVSTLPRNLAELVLPAYSPAKVRVPTDQALPLTGDPITLDGVSCIANDHYLLAGQSPASENGVYRVVAGSHARANSTGTYKFTASAGTSAGQTFVVNQSTGAVSQLSAHAGATDGRTSSFDNTAPGQHP